MIDFKELYTKICLGEISKEQFEKQLNIYIESRLADKNLEISLLQQRYKNANNLALQYMNEFEKRGLVYIPVVSK